MDLIKWDALQKEINQKQIEVNSVSNELIKLFAKALAESEGKKSIRYYENHIGVRKGFCNFADSLPCFRGYDSTRKYLLFSWEEWEEAVEEFWMVDAQRLIEEKLILQDLTSNLDYEKFEEQAETEKEERETYERLKNKFEGN